MLIGIFQTLSLVQDLNIELIPGTGGLELGKFFVGLVIEVNRWDFWGMLETTKN